MKNVINRFDEIANNQYVTMYISNISTGFLNTLNKHNLTNVFDSKNIYFRDTNFSYNKIDGFVSKHIQITDQQGMIQKESKNNDIIHVNDLKNGIYTIKISYEFSIPDFYKNYIADLEEKYEININDREMAILGLKSGMYEEEGFGKVRKRRETKATVYFPQYITVANVTGDIYYQAPFTAPFANGIFYQAGSIENNTTKTIKMTIEVKK